MTTKRPPTRTGTPFPQQSPKTRAAALLRDDVMSHLGISGSPFNPETHEQARQAVGAATWQRAMASASAIAGRRILLAAPTTGAAPPATTAHRVASGKRPPSHTRQPSQREDVIRRVMASTGQPREHVAAAYDQQFPGRR